MSGVLLRFDLPCAGLGFEAPSAATQLRFLPHGDSWTIVALVPAGRATATAAWLAAQAECRITMAAGVAPRTLRCELLEVPPRWLHWLTAARVVQVDLTPQGMATMFVQGTTDEVAALAGRLGTSDDAVRQRVFGTVPVQDVSITPRQLEVLCNAVAMGYYDVPHRVDLRRLGKSMNLSVSAVSQLLRRAQGQVIRGFIDANTLARGKRLSDPDGGAGQPPKGA
ncbi:MAG: hypothetical protein QOD77_237 [Thermoplasmata archaeon]|jgi:hypothetical protein|nr:hypothetical protein [Thermoplasmata archaeon]